ncbi:MAG: DNA primase [Lactobacillus paracasei subsp. paracasei]|nr:DNA primase [Lacticaseibacillus paracasei subsp. paracasei]
MDEQTKMLMEIKEDIASIKQQLTGLPSTDEKANEAYNASQDNARDISSLRKLVWSIWGVLGGTIGVTLFVYIIEKYL